MISNTLLKEYLISAVSGDYETMSFLRSQITQWCKEHQLFFSEDALLAAINEAIKDEIISTYKYNPTIHSFEKCDLRMDSIDEYWFLKNGALGYPHNL